MQVENQGTNNAGSFHGGNPHGAGYGEPVQQERKGRFLDPALILSVLFTGGYYGAIFQPVFRQTVLFKYTTEHIVEYVIVFLFFWGVLDILFKLAGFPGEFSRLRQRWFPPCRGREPIENARMMLNGLHSRSISDQHSRLGSVLIEILQTVCDHRSAKDCREQLQRISEREDDRLHARYTLVRFVVAVTPILGFLGTVVHFGTALSGLSFDEIDKHLPMVVSEMGTAFNTTTVALATAMTVMFLMFLCERIDRGILSQVERFVEREIVARFEVREQQIEPFLRVIQAAHEEAMVGIGQALEKNFQLWRETLEGLTASFKSRQEESSRAWEEALSVMQTRHQEAGAFHQEEARKTLAAINSAEAKHLERMTDVVARVSDFRGDLKALKETLQSVAEGEGKLADVQVRLAENLQAVHQSGQLDEALHGLTAAIHLITARYRPLEGYDAAA